MSPELLFARAATREFTFGLPELKAVLLAVVIISVWAALRYGRRAGSGRDPVR